MSAPLEEQSRYRATQPTRQLLRMVDRNEAVRDRVRNKGRAGYLTEPAADPTDAGDELGHCANGHRVVAGRRGTAFHHVARWGGPAADHPPDVRRKVREAICDSERGSVQEQR